MFEWLDKLVERTVMEKSGAIKYFGLWFFIWPLLIIRILELKNLEKR